MSTAPHGEAIVEQRHRDAAADLWAREYGTATPEFRDTLDGRMDSSQYVQAFAKFERDLLASLTPPSADGELRETYWLIERRCSPPQYAQSAYPSGLGCFYEDVMRAYRHPSKGRALGALRMMPEHARAECFVSEHMDVEMPRPLPETAEVERADKPSTEPEITEAINGLVAIHKRLIGEIGYRQRAKFPPPEHAWSDCNAILVALVELERAKAALSLKPDAIEQERESKMREALVVLSDNFVHGWAGETRHETIGKVERIAKQVLGD